MENLAVLRKHLEEMGPKVGDDAVLERMWEIGKQHGMTEEDLATEWCSYSHNNSACDLSLSNLEGFFAHMQPKPRPHHHQQHTPRRSTSQLSGSFRHSGQDRTSSFSQENLHKIFPGVKKAKDEDDDENLCSIYGPSDGSQRQGIKRELSSPTTPISKYGHTTPRTPVADDDGTKNTPSNYLSSTPAAKYDNRSNQGKTVCSDNEGILPAHWRGFPQQCSVELYDKRHGLTDIPGFMYQKQFSVMNALWNRLEEFGEELCSVIGLDDLSQAGDLGSSCVDCLWYIGRVASEGEGRLNPNSCLLEGVSSFKWQRKATKVQLNIPTDFQSSCSLFPGQIVAVEGVCDHAHIIHPNRIHDQGVPLPPPVRTEDTVGGLTVIAAAGPFTTSDNLSMTPLTDLIKVVLEEKPNLLLLCGPFVDISHSSVSDGVMEANFRHLFREEVIYPLFNDCWKNRVNTTVVIIPSQRDICHDCIVYPQPPYSTAFSAKELSEVSTVIKFVSDPATLKVNGVCIGVSSTDILFHLSSQSMFIGPAGNRMGRLASHILQQKCYYPLYPPHVREEPLSLPAPHVKEEPSSAPATRVREEPLSVPAPQVREEPVPKTTRKQAWSSPVSPDVNMDFLQAFEKGHALLPARPDILLLPSNLKPFVKVVDGCTCINPGHLTKKAGGGTYAKFLIQSSPPVPDISKAIGTQIQYI